MFFLLSLLSKASSLTFSLRSAHSLLSPSSLHSPATPPFLHSSSLSHHLSLSSDLGIRICPISSELHYLHVHLPPCILQLLLPPCILPLSHTLLLSPQNLELGFALSQSSIICRYTFPPAFSSYTFIPTFFLSLTSSFLKCVFRLSFRICFITQA